MPNPAKIPLDPEEALAGPLYALAAMFVVIPAIDFLLVVPPVQYASSQWRFSAAGLLSSHTLLPILGLAIALVVSAVLKHYSVQRLLVITCLTLAIFLAAVSAGFVLDVKRLRISVPAEERPAFNSAWMRALIKHTLSAAALAYLAWRAWLMIPASSRHRGPKPVHVVSK